MHVLSAPTPSCAFCGRGQSRETCSSCERTVFLDGLFALTSYADKPTQTLLRQWKYHGEQESSEAIERMVRRAFIPIGENVTVSFVPLHLGRRRGRGFDQAEQIAKTLSMTLDRPFARTLVRHQKTAPMAGREGRLVGDMDGVFRFIDPVPESVLLCDDVFTSGATMDAAAKALKHAGCHRVWGFVIAKG